MEIGVALDFAIRRNLKTVKNGLSFLASSSSSVGFVLTKNLSLKNK